MRLLSTKSLQLEQFNDEERLPPYAILSHTWGEEEVTLDDLLREHVQTMIGYRKIEQTCRIAAQDGFGYVWIDTCCIDKSSSAELSEAINSMFRWYALSQKCYAYLEDLVWHEGQSSGVGSHQYGNAHSLQRSRWFTRGWTLQELIAPSEVYFYDKYWTLTGTRTALADILAKITSVDLEVLVNLDLYISRTQHLKVFLRERSVAQRMSWASKRKTTRPEDLAYCLLGIFDIHMPLLYGEGIEKAFRRLQMEILRYSTDQSILAWKL
ncbi:HET-domain-containing protein, partial [Paraphaeosphaeria sporulosa]